MGRAERDEAEVVVDGRLEVVEAVGTNSSRRKAKRAAKIEELAGVNEAKEGIFFPAKETPRFRRFHKTILLRAEETREDF